MSEVISCLGKRVFETTRYNTVTKTNDKISATGCAKTSPNSPNIPPKINTAGINIKPCRLIFTTSDDFAAPAA